MRSVFVVLATLALVGVFVPFASASAPRVCTGDLVESVQACAGTDGCASYWLGPSGHTYCAFGAVGAIHVCTGNLIESVQACVDTATMCVTLYLGPAATPVCVGKLQA